MGDSQGVDLRGKKIKDLSAKEFDALLDGMKKVEGFQEGKRIHQMAVDALGHQLGATHSPEQIDTLARSAAAMAAENASRGDVQGVFLSNDQRTIALKQQFGISEMGVQEALDRPPADAGAKVAATDEPQHASQQPEAPQIAAMAR